MIGWLVLSLSSGCGFAEQTLGCGEVQVSGGADGGGGEGVTFGEAVGHFVADDGVEFGIGGFLLVAMANAAEIEIRAIADVALVLIGPADEAVVTVFRFHGGKFTLAPANRQWLF